MQQTHSQRSLDLGLFTFYITQNKQHQNYQIIYPLKQSNENYSAHRRNQQNVSKKPNDIKNTDNQQDRTEKLNKFLSNCVGYRQKKSLDNRHSKYDQMPNNTQNNHQPHNGQKQILPNRKQLQSRKERIQHKTKRQSKLKYSESEIVGVKKMLQVKKLNIHEETVQQRKIMKLRRSNKQQYLKINDQSPLKKQKQDKVYLKLNTREKQLQEQQKIIQQNINDIKQYFRKYQQSNPGQPKSKIVELKLLNHLYPRLIRHHSQQLFIQPSKNTINVTSAINKNLDNCCHYKESDRKQKQQKYHKIQKQVNKIKNQINILQNLDRKVWIQTQKKKLTNKLKINLQNKQENVRLSILSAQDSRHMIKPNQILGCKNKKYEKKNNRLQLNYKNKKNAINLPPLNLLQKNIQNQNHINEIYYSVDHRQKKPLQINVGVFPNNRLFEGWQQRKKELLQKITSKDEKQTAKVDRNQTNTRNSHKNGITGPKNKQNRIQIKSKMK